jgi:hypothetical protein
MNITFIEIVPYLLILGLVLVYVGTYLLNKRTPVPEECKVAFNEATCKSCHNFSCSHHK